MALTRAQIIGLSRTVGAAAGVNQVQIAIILREKSGTQRRTVARKPRPRHGTSPTDGRYSYKGLKTYTVF
eukprot:372385-Amphidinium_carterae.1